MNGLKLQPSLTVKVHVILGVSEFMAGLLTERPPSHVQPHFFPGRGRTPKAFTVKKQEEEEEEDEARPAGLCKVSL